ncbi:aspartate kinase [Georgenia ruanii]|uniref:Aspartokinase n=1 Tax=Georgenia ruanii TaxID=348442 RepID=A0A7J9UTC4_9MICO|nr:aspartate kinase [Georgenia ruanii]
MEPDITTDAWVPDAAVRRRPREALVVQKFGGSSVADPVSIRRVAHRVLEARAAGRRVVVVVSAMGDTTDELLDLANGVTPFPSARELDVLLSAGERISTALLALALTDRGVSARAFTGPEAGLVTDGTHGKAHLVDVNPRRIRSFLRQDGIAVVAGFQGESRSTKEVTTLGRGGSDITAVALAAALGAAECEIYTDVAGVYSADPRVVPAARKIPSLTSEEMLELAAAGAKVLHPRCVEYARRFGVVLHVRSSFTQEPGTLVLPDRRSVPGEPVELEQPIVTGVTADPNQAKVTVTGVPDAAGAAARIFRLVARAGVRVEMIVQNAGTLGSGRTDISFTVPAEHGPAVVKLLREAREHVGFLAVDRDEEIALLSVRGFGMRQGHRVFPRVLAALARAGVNVEMISASEFRIAVVVRADALARAEDAVGEAFSATWAEVPALV